MMEELLRKRLATLERRFNLLVLIVVIAAGGGIAAARKPPDVLRVRQLSIVDANGVERVRIGAPLPEPPILGKRFHRDGNLSGILLFDAEGNERSGYATGDDYPNVLFTLDSLATQHVLFMAEPQGSPTLLMWDEKKGGLRLFVDEGQPHIRYSRAGQKAVDLVAEPSQ
jgi:hypothetical protein